MSKRLQNRQQAFFGAKLLITTVKTAASVLLSDFSFFSRLYTRDKPVSVKTSSVETRTAATDHAAAVA